MANFNSLPLPQLAAGPVDDCAAAHPAAGGACACRADYELVQKLVDGDAAAWRKLVLTYERLVLSRVLATGRELHRELAAADAEDLCAEVFSRLVADDYAALRRFEGRSTLSTWLSVITRRVVARRLAAARSDPSRAHGGETSLEALVAAPSQEPSATMISAEDAARLAVGMEQLGERQRLVARLFYVEGRSYREISQRLGMPINSIGPTLARVQEKLRKHMSEE